MRVKPEVAASILECVQSAVIVIDHQDAVRYANREALALIGCGDEIEGVTVGRVLRLFKEPNCERVEDYESLARDGGSETLLLLRPDGTERHVTAKVLVLTDGQSKEVALVLSDGTELREMRRRMLYMASHDLVTGTVTRRELAMRLSKIANRSADDSQRHSLTYVAIEGLESVMNAHGIEAEDALLTQLGHFLISHAVRADAVARLGDSEFGILTTVPSDDGSASGDLLEALSRLKFSWGGATYQVSPYVAQLPVSNGIDANVLFVVGKEACARLREHGLRQVSVTTAELESRLGQGITYR